ncbi:type II secretion system protein GspH [Deinococcus sp. HMF7620]|uniref:Type II secretion system protein GspH n=1 Tax=Deinococcus arboris TaxID=2682977 RepID=A0A7C9I135_9DEIO|nr:type II secretion system protein GspH [Deinococcus arboris]
MSAQTQGFTLLELLVVMAILGILAGVLGLNLLSSYRASQLREAASQLSGDLRQARSDTLKTGQSVGINITLNSTAYTVTRGAGAQTRTLPSGVVVAEKVGETEVTYQAPTGTIGGNGVVWTLRHPGGRQIKVKVVGITGKVMIDATN